MYPQSGKSPQPLYDSPSRSVYQISADELLVVDGNTGRWLVLEEPSQYVAQPDSVEVLPEALFAHSRKSAPSGPTCSGASPRSTDAYIYVVHLTSTCNLGCTYCYASRPVPDISVSTLDRVIHFIASLSRNPSVQMIGGEPFLRFDLLRHAYDQFTYNAEMTGGSFRLLIQTNGTIWNRDILQFLLLPNVHVGVSLDGDREANVARVTASGYSTSQQVEKFIANLQHHGLVANVNCVLNRNNLPRLRQSLDYLADLGVKSVKYSIVYNRFEETDFDELYQRITDLYNWYLATQLWKRVTLVDLLRLIKNCLSPSRDYMCLRSPCGAGTSHFAFDSTGDIYSCDFGLGIPAFRLGNVLLDSPSSLIRKSSGINSRINVESNTDCWSCSLRKLCGNCQASSYSRSRTLNRRKLECDYMKRVIPWIMKLIHTEPALHEFLAGAQDQALEFS